MADQRIGTVERLRNGVDATGAIGMYLTEKSLIAEGRVGKGRLADRLTPHDHSNLTFRAIPLHYLSQVAHERGRTFMRQLTREDYLDAYVQLQGRKPRKGAALAPNTVHNYGANLKAFDKWAEKMKLYTHRQVDLSGGIVLPDRTYDKMVVTEDREMPEIFALAEAQHPIYRMLMESLYYTQLRKADVIMLRWRYVQWDERTLKAYVQKTCRDHDVRITTNYFQTLKWWRQHVTDTLGHEPDDNSFILPALKQNPSGFRSMRPNWPLDFTRHIDGWSFGRIVKWCLKTHGINPEKMKYQAAHIVRRSAAVAMEKKGHSKRDIAIALGHGRRNLPNTASTDLYLRHGIDDETYFEAVESLGNSAPDLVPIGPGNTGTPLEPGMALTTTGASDVVTILRWVKQGLLSEDEATVMIERLSSK